jgi:hypothetical protein
VIDKKSVVALRVADQIIRLIPLLKFAVTNDEEIELQLKGPNHSLATSLTIISSVGFARLHLLLNPHSGAENLS